MERRGHPTRGHRGVWQGGGMRVEGRWISAIVIEPRATAPFTLAGCMARGKGCRGGSQPLIGSRTPTFTHHLSSPHTVGRLAAAAQQPGLHSTSPQPAMPSMPRGSRMRSRSHHTAPSLAPPDSPSSFLFPTVSPFLTQCQTNPLRKRHLLPKMWQRLRSSPHSDRCQSGAKAVPPAQAAPPTFQPLK